MTKQDNKIISEFMGERLRADNFYEHWHTLMPVVEKINNLPLEEFNYNAIAMAELRWHKIDLNSIPITSTIEYVCNKCLFIIKWYNKAKQNDRTANS